MPLKTNVIFEKENGKKIAKTIECKVKGIEKGITLTEDDLVFVTNGSCTEGTVYGDQNHAPNGDAEVRTSGCWSLWKSSDRRHCQLSGFRLADELDDQQAGTVQRAG